MALPAALAADSPPAARPQASRGLRESLTEQGAVDAMCAELERARAPPKLPAFALHSCETHQIAEDSGRLRKNSPLYPHAPPPCAGAPPRRHRKGRRRVGRGGRRAHAPTGANHLIREARARAAMPPRETASAHNVANECTQRCERCCAQTGLRGPRPALMPPPRARARDPAGATAARRRRARLRACAGARGDAAAARLAPRPRVYLERAVPPCPRPALTPPASLLPPPLSVPLPWARCPLQPQRAPTRPCPPNVGSAPPPAS